MSHNSQNSLFEDDVDTSTPRKATHKKKHKKRRTLIPVLVGVLAFAIIAGCVAIYILDPGIFTDVVGITSANNNVFLEGVTVDGVSIAGMTVEQAREALKEKEAEASAEVNIPLTLDLTGKTYTVDGSVLNISYNTEEILAEAILLCINENNRVVEKQAEELALNGKNYSIEYTVDASPLTAYVADLAKQLNFEPVDATFGLVAELNQTGATPAGSASPSPTPTPSPSASPLPASAPIDASAETGNEQITLINEPFYYVTAIYGLTVDEAALINAINGMLDSRQYGNINIPYERIQPEKTLASYLANLVRRCSFFTEYTSSSARNFNLIKAAGLINGHIVAPGETFSINTVIGDRNRANGWKEAPAYIFGGAVSEMQYGGGVCQISTTLYNTVIRAGLTVTDRSPHSKPVGYIDGGLDATIDTGRIDMQWTNSTASNIYVFMWVDTDKKHVCCEIYGEPFPDEYDTIDFVSKRQSTIAALTGVRYIYSSDVPAGTCVKATDARKGSTWKSYAVYYKNGVEVKRVLVDDSKYNPMQETYLYGSGWTQPTPTPVPTPAPDPTTAPSDPSTPAPADPTTAPDPDPTTAP